MTSSVDPPAPIARIRSSVPGLDTILGGGFLRSGVYIVQGRPGCGKTILANQICYGHVAQGGSAVYVTLLAESHARMLQHLSIMSLLDVGALPDRLG
jgi:circadian clock protein KaiC